MLQDMLSARWFKIMCMTWVSRFILAEVLLQLKLGNHVVQELTVGALFFCHFYAFAMLWFLQFLFVCFLRKRKKWGLGLLLIFFMTEFQKMKFKLCILMSVQQEICILYPPIFTKEDNVLCCTTCILHHLALHSHGGWHTQLLFYFSES